MKRYLVLLLTMFVAAQTVSADDVWNFDASTGHLTVYKDVNYDYDLLYYWHEYRGQIKSIEFGSKVTKIGKYAFRDCTSLTSVIIPKGVTSIGQYAFEGCSALEDVTIPQSVTSIGKGAIRLCPSLTSIIIPNSVTNIDEFTFYGCSSLMSVTIPENVTSIGKYAFYDCTGLTSINIPESVTSIGSSAFSGCNNLKTVYNLSSLDIVKGSDTHGYVAYYAETVCEAFFFNQTNGKLIVTGNFNFDEENEYPWHSFRSSIKTVEFGPNVSIIGEFALALCSSLTSVTISKSVKSIRDYAFYGCSGLTNIIIGNGVKSIGQYAFYDCVNLKTVYNLSSLDIVKGSDTHGYVAYYAYKVLEKVVDLDYSSKYLVKSESFTLTATVLLGEGSYTVTWSSSDTSVATVTDGVVTAVDAGTVIITATVGDYSATCEVTVLDVEPWIFDSSTGHLIVNKNYEEELPRKYPWDSLRDSIKSVEFSPNVTIIGVYAFYYCSSLTSVTIPESVTSIGNIAFYGCSNLKTVINLSSLDIVKGAYTHGNVAYYADKVLTKGVYLEYSAIRGMVEGHSFTLTATVIPEGSYTVKWSSSNTDVATVKNGVVTAVGAGTATITATAGKYSATCEVTVLEIPVSNIALSTGSVSLIEGDSYTLTATISPDNATDKSVTWSSSDTSVATVTDGVVTAVDAGTVIITATVGDYSATCEVTVLDVEPWIFDSSTGHLIVNKNYEEELPRKYPWDSLRDSIKSVEFSPNVTIIGVYAFYYCSSLTSVTIPESVTIIGKSAFCYCSSLTSVTIPESVTSIGMNAFLCCSNLKTVINLSSLDIVKGFFRHGYVAYYAEKVLNFIKPLQLQKGEMYALSVPVVSEMVVTWSSSDASVAAVDQNGNVTAVGTGVATITATAGDYSATCEVTVTKQVTVVTLTEGVYYMKNVGAGLFLTGGNAWGTYGTFSENGFDVTVTMLPSGKFVIDTKVDNLGNHYLGADGFIDAPQAEWTIEPQTDGTYTITNDGVNYIGYDGSTTVLNLHLTNSSEDNAHWQFMTYEEVMAEISTATKDNPKIVTMLFPGASFNKNDTRNGLWSDAPTVGGYLTDVATNMCGEKWNTPSFDVAQTLTNVPNGYYKVSMQGFYRMGGDASKNDATIAAENHAAGTETLNAIFYANNEEKPLMSIIEGAQAEMFAYGQAFNTSYGYVPQNIGAAAATFTGGKYEHSLWVVVTDGTLRVGVKKDAESVNDWTIFDNFRIVYYGNHASGISIDPASMKLLKGESMTLSAEVTPEDATDAVTWSSSDASVATVDQNGNVTAVGVGTAAITATAGDYSATCEVTVTIPVIPVSGITLSQNAASLFVDEDMTLSAEVTPEDATDKTVTWSSSNASVATVDQNGNVTAVGAGTATITATAGDYSATCEVTVTKQVSLVTLTDGVYYMKNVGAGLFLTGGNAWGTYGTFSENGFDVTVTMLPSGKFVIDTKVDNLGNHYLGADGFIDAPQAEWTIEPQTDGTYTITNDGVNYIGYDGSTTVLNLHLTNSSEDNARWQFMTYEEVMAEISTATKDNPKTVTMLLPGAAFNQGDTRNGLWSDEPAVGGYQTEFASNKCGEKYSTPSFDVAQTLTNVPNGYYKVSMQGFYRMGGDENVYDASLAETHHKDGTETLNAIFYANNEEKRLMSIIEGAQAEEFAYGGAFYTAYGNVPQDMDAAAAAFTDGKYEHSLWVEVTDGTLRVGVKKDAESVRDWTIFDNFRVVYYGIQQPDAIEEATAIVTFQTNDVYDLSGRLVRRQAESLDGLKPGVYIVNGKKYMVK